MMNFFLIVAALGLITSTTYTILAGFAALCFAARRRRGAPNGFSPPVSLLKPLCGAEPELEAHLESFFRQDYPSFEILFCAHTENDPGLAAARRVAARYPGIPARFFLSPNPPYANAKVWSLEQMEDRAEHSLLVVSDSDVSVEPDYLRAVVAPFADERVGLVTCLYRGRAPKASSGSFGLWSRLEAVGMSVEMSSGVLVAEMLEGMKFALGPTMAVRRECLERAGGFHALRDYHADDFILGSLIAAMGKAVVLSTHVIDHHILNTPILKSLRHQIRWTRSTRFSRPKGHFGSVLTFGMPYALLGASVALLSNEPLLAVLFLAWGIASRMGLSLLLGRLVVGDPTPVQSALLYPLRDLLGFFCWAASYTSSDVLWRGKVYRLGRNGVMRMQPNQEDPDREVVLTS
jgi:ceramide glucosyltransferase